MAFEFDRVSIQLSCLEYTNFNVIISRQALEENTSGLHVIKYEDQKREARRSTQSYYYDSDIIYPRQRVGEDGRPDMSYFLVFPFCLI